MGGAMQDPIYRSYVELHGPEELQLTIDASRAIAAQPAAEEQPAIQPQAAPEAPVTQAAAPANQEPVVRFIRPDMATALEEKDRLELPATERSPQNFTDWTEAASMAARLQADYNNQPRSPEYSRNVAAIAIEAQTAIAAGVGGDREFYGNDKAFHEAALVEDIARTMGENEHYANYVQIHASSDLATKIDQVSGLDGEDIAHEEQDWLEMEMEMERRRDYLSDEEKLAEDQAFNDPERLDELRTQHDIALAERLREPDDLSQTPDLSGSVDDQAAVEVERPAAPEPLNFTHNGQPATIDLERFKSPADLERRGYLSNDEKLAEDQAVNDPERLAELRTQHDQAAADRNQERGEFWANRDQATVEVERPAAPEPLNFTHNGQPATIDLERYKQKDAELERRGHLSNDEKQAEDQAVNDPERLAELRAQHDQAAAERNQARGELWANREQAQPVNAELSPAVAARVVELQSVNANYVNPDPEQVYDDIVRKGTLADARMRHDELDSGFVDNDKIREIAGEDLKAFVYLEGKPEQQALALAMGRAMENEHYSSYMADNAPQNVGITIEAAVIVSDQQQTMAPAEIETPTGKDMEL
jgi:hypothetical protein